MLIALAIVGGAVIIVIGMIISTFLKDNRAEARMKEMTAHTSREEKRCNKLAQAIDNLSADVRDLQRQAATAH